MESTLEQMLVERCAPTLAGVKPANLFRCADSLPLFRSVYEWNQKLCEYGIRIWVVKRCRKTHTCLIYVCRWHEISGVLQQTEVQAFLRSAGYDISKNVRDMICQLSRRLCVQQDFPHEIGIFLGYPLADVIGFIQNKGKNYSCCGYWKCYGDAQQAKKLFDTFSRCIAYYKQMYRHGVPLVKMIAA